MVCKNAKDCKNFEGEDNWKCDECRRMLPKFKRLQDWFEEI